MAEASDLSLFVSRGASGTAHMTLAVDGVGCASCIRKIEGGLKKLPGIIDARLNFTNRRLAVEWSEGELDAAAVIAAVERIGYKAQPFEPARAEADEARHARWLLKCLAVAGFAAMNIMLLSVSVWSGTDMTPATRDFFHWLSALIALPTAVYAGRPFFQSAWKAIRGGSLNMDVPISLGVTLALILSVVETALHAEHAYFDSAVMLLFFLLCGRYLDQAMRRKTRAVAANLAALKADFAHRLEDNGELVRLPVGALRPGDRLLVRPGDRIPADGSVISGTSEIDESLVTGETARRRVGAGTAVYAGAMNFSGALTLRVIAADGGTLIDEVERLLQKAIEQKSQTVRLADRVSRYYAPFVHATAALTAIGWLLAGASVHDALVTAITVLIITCPCALALAIPTVQVVASGALFRSGLILNAGDAIERLAEVDIVIFDKTGTLTWPEPRVEKAAAIAPDMLETAARLALSSHHPLAAVLAREARVQSPYADAIEEPGRGVRVVIAGSEARLGAGEFCDIAPTEAGREDGLSTIAFSHAGRQAVLEFRQKLRPDAAAVVSGLKQLGLDVRILSGDRAGAVGPVAAALGVESFAAAMRPDEKIKAIETLKVAGRQVLMVGDGINDAPALAAAHVSISPISAADITQAQADAVFLGDQLLPVLEALRAARAARRLMRENLLLAVIYNTVAVPVAIAGLVTPLIAAAAMSGSSTLVTLNALRANRRSLRRETRA
ncbi:MAG TPA: heavy metal translocating P-type ATPase [Xanthobacteraceae bacterium]|nr:heavy metal translocating P-type ATPase [Xanthobacteraceae bacterium]